MGNAAPLPCPPVGLFVFNRPDCTARVIEAIRQAEPRRLFVVADGPRTARKDDRNNCQRVRELVEGCVSWQCEVTRIYSETNLGCAARVASGLTAIFDAVEEAVILEDDCVPAPSFFPFCAELLSFYRNEPRIGMIAGTNFRGPCPNAPESYLFSSHYSVWGWATWRRAFTGFDPTMSAWRTSVHPSDFNRQWVDSRSRRVHIAMFDTFVEGNLDTWDIPWCFHLATQAQVCAVPGRNLVTNIGTDGAHTSGGSRNQFIPTGSLDFPLIHPNKIAVDNDYNRAVASTHRLYRSWMRALWTNRVRRLLRRWEQTSTGQA